MQLIDTKWNTIRKGTKVYTYGFSFREFENKLTSLDKGYYYIVGFWANLAGLNKKRNQQLVDVYIPSIALKDFYLPETQ